MSENEGDLVVGAGGAEGGGRRGDDGYLSGEQKEALVESGSELAPYKDLKFKTPDKSEEPSEEDKALSGAADLVVSYRNEAKQQRSRTQDYELADGVEQLVDSAEQLADELDYDEAEELRWSSQMQALQSAAMIEDEELRQRTLQKLEDRVDPDLYEAFANEWQQAYVEQSDRDIETALQRQEAANEQQLKVLGAVVQLENDLLNKLSPLEQACAMQLLTNGRDVIAQMSPEDAQEALRTVMEMARDAAGKMEAAQVQESIIKAHGKTKGGLNGRQLKELGTWQLGLLPELVPTAEEVQAANERAKKGTKIDRQAAKRIHRGSGPTGLEKLQAQTVEISKRLGVPVHDAATGRRLD